MAERAPFHPEALTWTALLARWIDFARASLAIPDDADGERWRAVVPAVINLQAVTFALADLAALPVADRALARDRAEILVDESAAAIGAAWRGEPLPASLASTTADARAALAASVWAGAVELVVTGAGSHGALVVPALPEAHLDRTVGTLAVMQPGTIAMPGEPVAWWVDRVAPPFAASIPGVEPRSDGVPRQVYRQLDDEGRIARDVIAPITAAPQPGLPLLVPLCDQGRAVGSFTLEAETWLAQQRQAMRGDLIEVLEVDGEDA